MKAYLHLILLTGMSFVPGVVLSQNILTSSVEWKSALTTISSSNSSVNENTRVVSTPTQITWYNEDGTVKKQFAIVKPLGSWSDISRDGYIVFSVNSNGDSGTIHFSKTQGVVQLSVHIIEDLDSVIYDLTVTTVNVL